MTDTEGVPEVSVAWQLYVAGKCSTVTLATFVVDVTPNMSPDVKGMNQIQVQGMGFFVDKDVEGMGANIDLIGYSYSKDIKFINILSYFA